MSRFLAMVGVAVGLSAAAADDKAAKDELAKFTGTWAGVSEVVDGKEKPHADVLKLTVDGEKYTLKTADGDVAGTHTLAPGMSPKQIDAVRTAGPHKGEKMLGVYELTADTFTVCFAPPGKTDRPTALKSAPGSGLRLITFKREKP